MRKLSGVRIVVHRTPSLIQAERVRDDSLRVISARELQRAAEVLAELMGGKCFPFRP